LRPERVLVAWVDVALVDGVLVDAVLLDAAGDDTALPAPKIGAARLRYRANRTGSFINNKVCRWGYFFFFS
jgi:hypothetical protein